ncbi:lipopolysaccharide biosynthesis protein [Hydrogenophaga sp. MI9]|uniref:lipopolysaccharide biosynthesis protein n=1 Tax=Hydrogenophaga sp. MI9 TaxID=3453719 RepID=UPI003EEE3585
MIMRNKILRNLGANTFSQIVNLAIQLLSVPLFLHFWPMAKYGEWLILSTIPTYIALSDIGFATVAANQMTMLGVNEQQAKANNIYQSAWIFVSIICLILFCVCIPVALNVDLTAALNIKHTSEPEAKMAVIALLCYATLNLQFNVFSAAFRAANRYAYSTYISGFARLFEWLATALFLFMGATIAELAIGMCATRLVATLYYYHRSRAAANWLRLGFSGASVKELRKLAAPAVAFMAFPVGLSLGIQGATLAIGIALGPAAVVMFSACRTFTRALVQLATTLNQSIWPEASRLFGLNDISSLKSMHQKASSAIFWMSCAIAISSALLGGYVIEIWTKGAIVADTPTLLLLILAAFINVNWQTSWVVLMATNRHSKISLYFVASSALTLAGIALITPRLGLSSAALVIAIAELPLLYLTIHQTLALLDDSWHNHIKHAFAIPFKLGKNA